MSIRPSVWVLAAAAALLLGTGCTSSGETKQAVSTNTRTAIASASTTTTTAQPVAASTRSDQCPPKPPTTSPKELNAGIAGLQKQLVPIAALTVRVCRYPKAVSPLEYDNNAATAFEVETNKLRALPEHGKGVSCGGAAPTYVVTFASASQQVVVVDFCGDPTNGAFEAASNATWVERLQTPTMGFPPAPPKCPSHQTEPSFNTSYCGPTPGPGNGLGPSGECTGRETAPPCGPGMIPGRYYAYTLPGRCDGRVILNGSRWRSELPPPTHVPDTYVWVGLRAWDHGPGFISASGAVTFTPDIGQPATACSGSG